MDIEEEKTNIDEEEVLELIKKKDSFYALCASKRLLRSKKFALKAVAADGLALEYFTKKIRSDFDVVLEAVKQNDYALEFASQDLKGDECIINNLILCNECSGLNGLRYMSKELNDSEEFFMGWMDYHSFLLFWASERIRNSKEFFMQAVLKDINSLKYASDDLRNNKELILKAIKQDVFSLDYASDRLKNDKEIILEVVKKEGYCLQNASRRFKDNKEVVLAAVRQYGYALEFASKRLREDKDVLYACKEMLRKEELRLGGLIHIAIIKKSIISRAIIKLNKYEEEDRLVRKENLKEILNEQEIRISDASRQISKARRKI